MRPHWIRLLTLPALLASVLAGCADAPQALVEPPSLTLSTKELRKVEGSIPAFHVEQVVGPEGAVLGVPGYTLTVPRGAVAEPTRFVFESLASGYVEVRLTATSLGAATENDVGVRGFGVPLLLAFSYEPAGGMPQWARLVVAWVRDDGTLERVPSGFDPRQRLIIGRLSHFSQYTVAAD
jgi:hypothetical protein